jgi:hypothetical protein
MQEMYKKSIRMMKRLKEQPTKAEWNKIAKEKCLLSYTSLRCYRKQPFHQIWKEVKGC